MDKKRQEKVYELLKRGLRLSESGEELPAEWARELFPPERREYELVYNGKETEEQILADTMAVPFQEVSTFGQNGVDWQNKLIFGDNLQAMKTLLQMKADGKLANADGTPGIRLIYIDPPFATKKDFKGTQEQKAYQDKIAGAEFLEFLRKRLVLMRELLSDDGSIYVHLDYKKAHYLKVLMDEIFGEHRFRNEIVWQRSDPHNDAKTRYGNIHDSIFYYTKPSAKYNWNEITVALSPAAIKEYTWMRLEDGSFQKVSGVLPEGARLVKLERATQKGNNEERIFEWRGVKLKPGIQWMGTKQEMEAMLAKGDLFLPKHPKGAQRCRVVYLDVRESEGQVIQDIWQDVGRMKGGQGLYPTQKPLALLERIIKASSKEGDIVLDAFAGSGTTLVAAEKLKRRWVGIDIGKLAIYTTQKRLLNFTNSPFTLYNAGLYDFDELRNLPWEDWRFFALQLFECKDEPHKIHGFQMDGKRQGSSVHVFNHFSQGTVSRETIADLHASIGKTVGDRCYIIAPRGAFLFQEDYIEMDGVRYYALRIPYSFINELHRREFSALVQPNDEMAINETVEAVGFDFIQPPAVELEVTPKKQILAVKIKKFESRARLRGGEKVSKHDALSMVMVDYDYDGKVFDLDKVFYANEIKDNKWKIELPTQEIEGDVMLVFLDIYGNEARIVISPKARSAKVKK